MVMTLHDVLQLIIDNPTVLNSDHLEECLKGAQNADQVMIRMGEWIETLLAMDDIAHLDEEL